MYVYKITNTINKKFILALQTITKNDGQTIKWQ